MSGSDRFRPEQVACFRYVDVDFDKASGRLRCRYGLDELAFEEWVTFAPARREPVGLEAAARLVFLLAGLSYYKAAAPPLVSVPFALTPGERALLEASYRDGLGEYAYRNDLDLSGLVIDAAAAIPFRTTRPATAERALIPFGGGIDSIVTVEGVRPGAASAALFVVSRQGDRFDALEQAAAVSGLPVVRAERLLDPKVLRSAALGYRNGHVPVTAIISAIAVMAALLDDRDAVVMSNEWSASSGNVDHQGRLVNHQWSKTLAFEELFRSALADVLRTPLSYFSWLRPFSELWVGKRFAELTAYHGAFRSCNRAFHIDRAARLDHWCGRCDKCCFVDLVLAPFLPAEALRAVFAGNEPLDNAELSTAFRTLAGLSGENKPFECVGDVEECITAALLAAARVDRLGSPVLGPLARELSPAVADPAAMLAKMLRPQGPHHIPPRHAPSDLLV